MFILKGKYMETTRYTNKEGKTVYQAVIYSEGEGKTYTVSGLNTSELKPLQDISVNVAVGVYDGRLYLRLLS